MRRREPAGTPVLPAHLKWSNRPTDPAELDAWREEWREWHKDHDVDAIDHLRAINIDGAA